MKLPLSLRLRRHAVRLSRSLRRRIVGNPATDISDRVAQYREYWSGAARELGAEFVELTDTVWEARLAGRSTRLTNYIVQIDDTVTNTLAGDKAYGYVQAERAGVPTPDYGVFDLIHLDEALRFTADGSGPFVVKPARGSASAIGITTHVTSRADLVRAACLASLFCDQWIVETMHFGESCRLLLLDGELLHAVRRRGLRVRGDGRHSVRELLPVGLGSDRTVRHTLEQQNRSFEQVLDAGEELLVRSLPLELNDRREPRTVYDESITEIVHPELVEAARSIAAALGTRLAGVDFVTPDPQLPLAASGVFLELNTTPGIHHHDTEPGLRPLPVAVRILSNLLCVSPQHPVAGVAREPRKESP